MVKKKGKKKVDASPHAGTPPPPGADVGAAAGPSGVSDSPKPAPALAPAPQGGVAGPATPPIAAGAAGGDPSLPLGAAGGSPARPLGVESRQTTGGTGGGGATRDVVPRGGKEFVPRAPRAPRKGKQGPAQSTEDQCAAQARLSEGSGSTASRGATPPIAPDMSKGKLRADPLPSEGPSRQMATQVKTAPKPLAAGAEQAMVKGMGDMAVAERRPAAGVGLSIPHRKDLTKAGTLGRPMVVETNHLPLDLTKMTRNVIHYDVAIDPDKPKRLMRPVLREVQRLCFPDRHPAFDGKKNLYASKLLPFGTSMSIEVKVLDRERDREKDFTVTLKKVNDIDMSSLINGLMGRVPQTSVQALDIILRNAPSNSMVQVGRSFFSQPEGRASDLGDGMEAWIGFFQSAIIGWKPFVNIDVAHKGFPKVQNCVGVVTDLFGPPPYDRELAPQQKDDFMKYIRELKVDYMVPGQPNTKRTFRVNGISKCSRLQDFELDDGRPTTVEKYYAQVKKYRVKYPFLPCLDVGSPHREKKILIPCELCTLVGGQVVIKKMTEKQTASLIKIAATDTDERKRKIVAAMRKCNFNADPAIREFGLRVNDTFQRVSARVLEPPQLQYKDKTPLISPFKGVWRANQFLDGKSIKRWTILSMDKYAKDEMLRGFAQQLLNQARQVGMTIDPPQEPINTKIQAHETGKLQDFLDRNKDLEVIFVVVQDSGNSYAKVKQMAELTVGVLTQCLKNRTLNRMNPATVGNILLKVNAKLNGVNHTFGAMSRPACLKSPCMIVGADVTHPPPDQNNMPSVAAVCASHDPKAFKYNLQYRLQPARMEIIQDLENIMRHQLLFFYSKTGYKPKKIIFYRDGVSEGQFQEVLNVEFTAIRRACKSVSSDDPNYEPNITFLVVQKRHHTRFFPTTNLPQECDGRNKNVPAGTIVDTIITHPTDLDFYLVSHASIQGVSRPTKYRRLWDDNDMSEDELELLTYYLCHMFTRCTRSVSYPAPTYYAHLAAYRARCYLDGMRITMTNLPHEQELRKIKDKIISGSPMFFV